MRRRISTRRSSPNRGSGSGGESTVYIGVRASGHAPCPSGPARRSRRREAGAGRRRRESAFPEDRWFKATVSDANSAVGGDLHGGSGPGASRCADAVGGGPVRARADPVGGRRSYRTGARGRRVLERPAGGAWSGDPAGRSAGRRRIAGGARGGKLRARRRAARRSPAGWRGGAGRAGGADESRRRYRRPAVAPGHPVLHVAAAAGRPRYVT